MHDDTTVKSDEAMARIGSDDCTDAEAEAIVADMVARVATIGTEAVARLHEAEGRPDLARIARLTHDQARTVLCYLNGANPDAMDRAFSCPAARTSIHAPVLDRMAETVERWLTDETETA